MADIQIWIQIENRPWDIAPNTDNIDRMTGQSIQTVEGMAGKPPVSVTLVAHDGSLKTRTMNRPLRDPSGNPTDALILRRYTANWAAPDDRKVNPWDLNELDPTDNGTMGTIPGAVIECNVGDRVFVHFRNMDNRLGKDVKARTHSLHTHGFVFQNIHDGAYPLSPSDPNQPVGPEAAVWASVGVTGDKQGDRVPPGGTFTYIWNTFGWPSTAGVWLYHDHSICDEDNIRLGAIGLVVIHNVNDTDNEVAITTADLPGGSPTGSPVVFTCIPFPHPFKVLPHDLTAELHPGATLAMPAMAPTPHAIEVEKEEHRPAAIIRRGDVHFGLSKDLTTIAHFCFFFYRTPPGRALYLLLFHELGDAGVVINGRKWLGNTPTLIAGPETKMRFGVVGMGDSFHTFHIHGHRWVIPGPDGNNPGAIQNSAQDTAVSQFEDTRTFGPANSFVFTVQQGKGSFMGARFTPDPMQASGLGEWHMHCHVLGHMMMGMMGSLLVVQGGEFAFGLPSGEPCPMGTTDGAFVVTISDNLYTPKTAVITAGTKVRWTNMGSSHTVTSNPGPSGCAPASAESFDSGALASGASFEHTFATPGSYSYHCEVHGCPMSGTVTVTP